MTTTTQTRFQAQDSTPSARSANAGSAIRDHVVSAVARREQRARDFGVGYGNSSGYASTRRYADNWGNARFQCG
jgi:hypothetical protein